MAGPVLKELLSLLSRQNQRFFLFPWSVCSPQSCASNWIRVCCALQTNTRRPSLSPQHPSDNGHCLWRRPEPEKTERGGWRWEDRVRESERERWKGGASSCQGCCLGTLNLEGSPGPAGGDSCVFVCACRWGVCGHRDKVAPR